MKRFQQEESQILTTDQEINRLKAVYQSLVQVLIHHNEYFVFRRSYFVDSYFLFSDD
jgi:hypothetical protein